MNARKKGNDIGRSGFLRNALFGIIGHVRNPFSMNSDRTHGVDEYRFEGKTRKELETAYFDAEMSRTEASMGAQNMIARLQKS